MSYIYKAKNILSNDGPLVFLKRLINFTLVKIKRLFRDNDFGDWGQIENKFEGDRLFILGNGPSLNKTPLHLLNEEYTMCFNRINLLFERVSWRPNFYVMTDDLLINDMHQEVNSEILPKVDYGFFPDIHPSNVDFKKKIGDQENVFYLNTDKPKFQSDLPNCGINKTVVNAGLQIAAFLGFREIYLIGVDMTFADQNVKKQNSRDWVAQKNDDPNHFDPRYFGKGRKYHNPTVHEMLEQFEIGREFFSDRDIKIYNAGIGGKLEVFERVQFRDLFDYSQQEEIELLLKGIKIENIEKDLTLTFPNAKELVDETDWDDKVDEMICPTDVAISLISKKIFDYIPYGPFYGKYLFLKRERYSSRRPY